MNFYPCKICGIESRKMAYCSPECSKEGDIRIGIKYRQKLKAKKLINLSITQKNELNYNFSGQ